MHFEGNDLLIIVVDRNVKEGKRKWRKKYMVNTLPRYKWGNGAKDSKTQYDDENNDYVQKQIKYILTFVIYIHTVHLLVIQNYPSWPLI